MLEIDISERFRVKENIFLQKIEKLEKYWAFDIVNGEYYTLNETSFWILENILEPKSTEELFDLFLSNYEVEAEVARKDLLDILKLFYSNNIIEGGKNNERARKEDL